MEQLLRVSRDPKGKVLSALEFPSWLMPSEPLPCSVDLVAWNKSAEMKYKDFPISHTIWGHAGLRGAFTLWQVNGDGFNTFVDVKNEEGEKWWIVANVDRENSGKLRFQLGEGLDLDSDLQLEAILLTKGTRLYE